MELSAKLDRVIAQHFGNSVGDLIGIVDLNELVGRGAGGVSIEVEVLHALSLGIESDDAGTAIGIREALGDQANVRSTHGLAEIGVVTHVAQVELHSPSWY